MTAEFIVAVHSVVYLNHYKKRVSSEELAKDICTNPARVRKVMNLLKKAGIVEVHGGASGGYEFVKRADCLSLYDLFCATEERFVKVGWRSGRAESDCPVAQNMAPVMDEIMASLEDCCRNKLSHILIADIEAKIFGGKAE